MFPLLELKDSPASTLDSSGLLWLKLDKLRKLSKTFKDYHSKMPEHKSNTAVIENVSKGVKALMEELNEVKSRNLKKLEISEKQSQNIRNVVLWIEVLIDIVRGIKESVVLVLINTSKQLEQKLADKEKIECLSTNNRSLEKQLENNKKIIEELQQDKLAMVSNFKQEQDDTKAFIDSRKKAFKDLQEKLDSCPNQATQELQKEMDYFFRSLEQRCDNAVERLSRVKKSDFTPDSLE